MLSGPYLHVGKHRTKAEIAAARLAEARELSVSFQRSTAERFEQMTEEGVSRAEVLTSNDERVCDECRSLQGIYELVRCPRPPFHGSDEERDVCRCIVLAVD